MSVEIEGLGEWESWMGSISDEIADEVINAVDKSTSNVHKGARFRVPVDTGDLRKSITKEMNSSRTNPEGEVYTELEYGDDVELGTYKQRAQPYMFPALEDELPKFEKNLKDAVRKGLD